MVDQFRGYSSQGEGGNRDKESAQRMSRPTSMRIMRTTQSPMGIEVQGGGVGGGNDPEDIPPNRYA